MNGYAAISLALATLDAPSVLPMAGADEPTISDVHEVLCNGALPTTVPVNGGRRAAPAVLHRIREVRREQGISIKRASQLMGKSIDELRHEESETTDLTIAQLYEWQRLLEVPIEDLLVEPYAPLSEPVLKRARMLRLMKTVMAIQERSNQPSVRRLAQTMINQLVEIMPELAGVTAWSSLDRRRSRNQNSRILESTYLNPASNIDAD